MLYDRSLSDEDTDINNNELYLSVNVFSITILIVDTQNTNANVERESTHACTHEVITWGASGVMFTSGYHVLRE